MIAKKPLSEEELSETSAGAIYTPKEHDRMQVEIIDDKTGNVLESHNYYSPEFMGKDEYEFDMFIFRRCDELGVSSQEIKWDDLARKREER